jgi:uncharacterized protein (TIGR01244 family)
MPNYHAPLVGLLLTLSLAVPQAMQAPAATVPGVTNYTRVDATVGCGGATAIEAYPALKQEGYAAIINLRQADEAGANIEASKTAAEAAGLKYIHVPMDGKSPSTEAADAFLAAVKDPSHSPVYIHCASANRVGAVWLIKRVVADGWDLQKATAEAERIGLRSPHLKQFALDYIARHKG